jgi:DNA (cytosine-5)-methyltransferase 1
LGFEQQGFRCVGAYDINPIAIQNRNYNMGGEGRIKDLSTACLRALHNDSVDVVLAGPPCQGFSTVGKRDLNDPRNALLLTVGRITSELRPKIALIENVAAVTSGEHSKYWKALDKQLRESGYRTYSLLCQANDLGVAQLRTRRVMLAWLTNWEGTLGLPVAPGGDLQSALRGINEDATNHEPRQLPEGSRVAEIAPYIKPGQKLSNVRAGQRAVHTWNIPAVFGEVSVHEKILLETLLRLRRRMRLRNWGDADPVTVTALSESLGWAPEPTLESLLLKGFVRRCGRRYDLVNTFNGKYRRLRWDQPSPTVDTRFGDPHYYLHPDENRAFTVREAARLQGFPDAFTFQGTEREQFTMIGNAVPPPLAARLAALVREAILS